MIFGAADWIDMLKYRVGINRWKENFAFLASEGPLPACLYAKSIGKFVWSYILQLFQTSCEFIHYEQCTQTNLVRML